MSRENQQAGDGDEKAPNNGHGKCQAPGCENTFAHRHAGRTRKYCSLRCRVAAWRARQKS